MRWSASRDLFASAATLDAVAASEATVPGVFTWTTGNVLDHLCIFYCWCCCLPIYEIILMDVCQSWLFSGKRLYRTGATFIAIVTGVDGHGLRAAFVAFRATYILTCLGSILPHLAVDITDMRLLPYWREKLLSDPITHAAQCRLGTPLFSLPNLL